MRGIAAFGLDGTAGADGAGRRRVLRIDGGAPSRCVVFGDQLFDRRLDLIGIAEEQRAIRIGALHGLDHEIHRLTGIFMAEIVAFEDIEHLDQLDAAR